MATQSLILRQVVADLGNPLARATYSTILGRGATAVSEPHHLVAKLPAHELWLAAVRDPEGNVIELMSEV